MRLVIGVALATIACGRDASPPGPAPGPPVRTAAAPPVDAAAAPPVDALAAEPVDAPAAPAEPPAPKDPAVRLAATAYMTCAVLASGAVACWGGGNAAPYRIAGWTDIASVSVSGDLLCGVHRSGRVECGAFKDSEIAGGRMRIATTELQGVTAARDVATFADAACVVERTGEVGCWLHGAAPSVQRAGVRGASAIVMGILTGAEYQYAGSFYGCALTGGRLACFEIRDARPLDTSNTPIGKRPLLRFGRARVSKITGLSPPLAQVGDYRLCAGSGAARRCVDLDPQLHYEEASLPRPDETIPPDRIKQLVRSYNHSCAIYTTGAVACWGENGDGQLGRKGDASAVPVLIAL